MASIAIMAMTIFGTNMMSFVFSGCQWVSLRGSWLTLQIFVLFFCIVIWLYYCILQPSPGGTSSRPHRIQYIEYGSTGCRIQEQGTTTASIGRLRKKLIKAKWYFGKNHSFVQKVYFIRTVDIMLCLHQYILCIPEGHIDAVYCTNNASRRFQ